jgi:hypothetical protein
LARSESVNRFAFGVETRQHRPALPLFLRGYALRTVAARGQPYRSKVYSKAGDSLAAIAVALNRLIAEERLTETRGLGATN